MTDIAEQGDGSNCVHGVSGRKEEVPLWPLGASRRAELTLVADGLAERGAGGLGAVCVGDGAAAAAEGVADEVGALRVAGEDELGVGAGGGVGLERLQGRGDAFADGAAVVVERGRVLDVLGRAAGHGGAERVGQRALPPRHLLVGAARHEQVHVGAFNGRRPLSAARRAHDGLRECRHRHDDGHGQHLGGRGRDGNGEREERAEAEKKSGSNERT